VTLSAGPDVILRGLIGYDNVKPYSVMILIISLAYICISLEHSGFFEHISLKVARGAGNSGRRLFLLIFFLTIILTFFMDNNVIILTMTFIILHIARNTGMNPLPFLLSQFFAVNISGMALYIGNPTNIIAADAAGISFVEHAKWMVLPSVVSAAVCLAILWLMFRRSISGTMTGFVLPRTALGDREGAVFGLSMLVLSLFFMSLPQDLTGLPIWAFPSIFAVAVFLRDAFRHRSRVSAIASKVPWRIVPFLIGLFAIAESLASTGWTSLLASGISPFLGNAFSAVMVMCFASSFAASMINNHPMVVIFTRTLQNSQLQNPQRLASHLALIAGSNFGANLTLVGALAGMMWAGILADRGLPISFSSFSRYGLAVMIPVMLAASMTLFLELALWGGGL
ncbi:MAG: ArsB/NhaD family transporter, partial [Candidatus Hadarchaeales archaeon]